MLIIQLVELIVDFECAFSALTLLVGHQEVHPVRKKNRMMRVGVVICLEQDAECLRIVQLMPLHPKTHHLLHRLNPDFFYLSDTGSPRLSC